MKKPVETKQSNVKTIILVSLFWVAIAGVFVLVQATDKNAYNRGMIDGLTKCKVILQSK